MLVTHLWEKWLSQLTVSEQWSGRWWDRGSCRWTDAREGCRLETPGEVESKIRISRKGRP